MEICDVFCVRVCVCRYVMWSVCGSVCGFVHVDM